MTTSIEHIAGQWRERRANQGPLMERLRTVRDLYNNDLSTVLADMDRNEPTSVANLFKSGIDQLSMRVGNNLPNLEFPPLRPGIQRSEDLARTRKRAMLGQWESNRMGHKLRLRARHLIGYATSPVVLRPDAKSGIARWEVRDPLQTYAAPCGYGDELVPPDVIFAYPRTLRWLQDNYPLQARQIERGYDPKPHDRFDLLEYVDADETVLVLLGKSRDPQHTVAWEPTGHAMVELLRVPNLTGMPQAVIPGAITLDRRTSAFEGMVGAYLMQARMMALELIAVEKGIFPDMFLESEPGTTAQLLGGNLKDGRTGEINVLKGGRYIERTSTPGQLTNVMIDRLERNMRVGGGISSDLGGESGSNIRTGRRGEQLLSAVTDFPVQEAQELLAASIQEECKIAIAIEKAHFGERPKRFYVQAKGAKGNVDYKAAEIWEDDHAVVKFSGGGDVNNLVIGAGQRVGMGTLSKQSFMEVDPMVGDATIENDRVTKEAIEAALLSSIQQQAAAGAIPPADLARIMQLVVSGESDLADAVVKVQAEAQERQATQVAPEDPMAQPGLAQPGMGAEASVSPIEGPSEGQEGLAGLLSALRSPNRTLPMERAVA